MLVDVHWAQTRSRSWLATNPGAIYMSATLFYILYSIFYIWSRITLASHVVAFFHLVARNIHVHSVCAGNLAYMGDAPLCLPFIYAQAAIKLAAV